MSDDAVRVQQIEAELRELRQTLGIQYAELHRCMTQRDDATRTLARVMAIEIDPHWVRVLRERHDHELAAVVQDDYLRRAMHDVAAVVMNPPYEDGLDGRFLAHAMTHADRVAALLRVNSLTGQERHAQVWSRIGSDWQLDGLAYMARRPQFSAAGVDVGHAQHDFCAVRLLRTPKRRKCEVQWWT